MSVEHPKTKLERIQFKIDMCNNKKGCDNKCSLKCQQLCSLLKSHSDRITYCMDNNISIEKW